MSRPPSGFVGHGGAALSGEASWTPQSASRRVMSCRCASAPGAASGRASGAVMTAPLARPLAAPGAEAQRQLMTRLLALWGVQDASPDRAAPPWPTNPDGGLDIAGVAARYQL